MRVAHNEYFKGIKAIMLHITLFHGEQPGTKRALRDRCKVRKYSAEDVERMRRGEQPAVPIAGTCGDGSHRSNDRHDSVLQREDSPVQHEETSKILKTTAAPSSKTEQPTSKAQPRQDNGQLEPEQSVSPPQQPQTGPRPQSPMPLPDAGLKGGTTKTPPTLTLQSTLPDQERQLPPGPVERTEHPPAQRSFPCPYPADASKQAISITRREAHREKILHRDFPMTTHNDATHRWQEICCAICGANACNGQYFIGIAGLKGHVLYHHPNANLDNVDTWCDSRDLGVDDIRLMRKGNAPQRIAVSQHTGIPTVAHRLSGRPRPAAAPRSGQSRPLATSGSDGQEPSEWRLDVFLSSLGSEKRPRDRDIERYPPERLPGRHPLSK